MNRVVPIPHGVQMQAFRLSVKLGLRDETIVFPIPPRLLLKQRDAVIETLLHGPEAAGIAFMTSGTVGTSKLVVRSAASVLAEAQGVATTLGLRHNSKVLITTPIAHSYGFGIFMACVEANSQVWIVDDENIFTRLTQIRYLMSKHRFSVMTGVPFIFHNVLRQVRDLYGPSLSLAGGENVPVELTERWETALGSPLRQEYGLSEAGVVTIGKAEDPPGSIGRPVADCSVRVRNDELIVYREGNPTSYFSGESSDTFTGYGGVRTGDLGHNVKGLLYLTGRKDSLVIVDGMNVIPEEVEGVLLSSPLCDECVVVGRTKQNGSIELVAHVTPPVFGQNRGRLLTHARENLSSHKIPRLVNWSNLPRTASGKVDRRAILNHVPSEAQRKKGM